MINWPIVAKGRVFTDSEKGYHKKFKKGDRIIFFISNTENFCGLFEAVSDWYESEYEWPDKSLSKFRIDLKPIQLGFAHFATLFPKLEFCNKRQPREKGQLVMNSGYRFANFNTPISDKDCVLILNELKNNQTPPEQYTKEEEKINQEKKKIVKNSDVTFWLVSAGEKDVKAKVWNEFKNSKSVGVFWNNTGDVTNLSRDEIISKFKKLNFKEGSSSLVEFKKIKKNHYIFVNDGMRGLFGVGKAISDYHYDPNHSYHHVVSVEWITTDYIKTDDILGNPRAAVSRINKNKERYMKYISKMSQHTRKNTIIENLELNHQVILYGPPGTSKTFNAKKTAVEMLLNESVDAKDVADKFKELQNQNKVDLIQFHPSYSYEDFVQGIKPVTKNAVISYEVRDGIFKKICNTAKNDPDNNYLLIIDEINRGNLSKIFGELIYALEYRGEQIRLQYADFDDNDENDFLIVPKNLYVIGTMNTADRSVSLFDTAMRRRFAFVPMMVDYDLVTKELEIGLDKFDESALQNKLKSIINKHQKNSILSLLAVFKLNKIISKQIRMGREKQIGHTYLIRIIKKEQEFNNVWKYQIIPLLEEFYATKIDELKQILNKKIFNEQTGLEDFTEDELNELLNSIISKID